MGAVNTIEVDLTSIPFEYGPVLVYTRENWADDWEEDETLFLVECTWSSGTAISTAAFVRHYGEVMQSNESAWTRRLKADYSRQFVKVGIPTTKDDDGEWQYRYWYGVFDVMEDDQGGITTKGPVDKMIATATGIQTFTAYGLEKLLAESPIRTARYWSRLHSTPKTLDRGLVFNRDGRGNRSSNLDNDSFIFEGDLAIAYTWPTVNIVEYLLAHHTPVNESGTRAIPWSLIGHTLPNWDRPIIDSDGETVFGLLNTLVNASHLLGWHTVVDETTNPDTIQVEIYSLSQEDLHLPTDGDPTLGRNTEERELICDDDPLTQAVVKSSGVPCYEQIIVRGARKRTVASWSIEDGTIGIGWTNSGETLYEQGALASMAQATYDSLNANDKHKANATARSSPSFAPVFSLFTIPKTWSGQTSNGEATDTFNYIFPDGAGLTEQWYWGELFFENRLPLMAGEDYSLTRIADGNVNDYSTDGIAEEIPPMVFFRRPDDQTKWILGGQMGMLGQIETVSETENNTISVSLDVPSDVQGVYVRCSGEQHAIAATDFSPLDDDPPVGGYDFRHMILTMSNKWDQYVEGRYPADEDIDATDAVRIKVIDAGESYRSFYVAPGTVVAIDAEGNLVRSTGGWVPDNEETETQLDALAKLAFSYWGTEHRILGLTTSRIIPQDQLDVGDLITTLGTYSQDGGHYQTLNVVVTQIKISWPVGETDSTPSPHMTIETSFGELDPIRVAGRQRQVPAAAAERFMA